MSYITDSIINVARLPFLQPRLQTFSITSLLRYLDAPGDWNNLEEDGKFIFEPVMNKSEELDTRYRMPPYPI